MKFQDILLAIQSLAESERVALLEELTRFVKADSVGSVKRSSSLARVRGILKVEDTLPAEHELLAGLVNDLLEKYS